MSVTADSDDHDGSTAFDGTHYRGPNERSESVDSDMTFATYLSASYVDCKRRCMLALILGVLFVFSNCLKCQRPLRPHDLFPHGLWYATV